MLALAWLLAALLVQGRERYTEELTVESLPDGRVHSSFQFVLTGPVAGEHAAVHHSTLLPHSLLTLLRSHETPSLSLTLSSGRPPSGPSQPASGLHLVAQLDQLDEPLADEQQRWSSLTAALGSLFCAGLQGNEGTASPDWAIATEHGRTLYSLLKPTLSATCTESLTPFLDLLPCEGHAGIASLLNPHKLFDGDFTLLALHFRREDGAQGETVEVRLEVGTVLDPVRAERLRGGPGRRGGRSPSREQTSHLTAPDFSMHELFDRTIVHACPVASQSEVRFLLPNDSVNPFVVEPGAGKSISTVEGRDTAIWDTSMGALFEPLDLAVRWETEMKFNHRAHSPAPCSTDATQPSRPSASSRRWRRVGSCRATARSAARLGSRLATTSSGRSRSSGSRSGRGGCEAY